MAWPGGRHPLYEGYPGQIYATCAQIQVESDVVDGKLPKGILIPEAMSDESPGKVSFPI